MRRKRITFAPTGKFWRTVDVIILAILPVAAVLISLAVKAGLLLSTILFYGLPGLYLSFRTPKGVKRALIFSLAAGSIGLAVDYLAAKDLAWIVPSTIFPLRLLGVSTVEAALWGYFYVYAIVIFYEHFLDKGRHNLIASKFRYGMYIVLGILVPFFSLYLFAEKLLTIPYIYFKGSLALGVVPVLLFLGRHPHFLSRFVKVGAYFFIVSLMHELTALELGQWIFPGHNFIGWVELFGFRLPFEEFFFYISLSAISTLCFFEYFDDSHMRAEERRNT